MQNAEPLKFGLEFSLIAGLTGIGWLLTVICLIHRFDRSKDRYFIHFIKDIINATFASIVVVAAVSISINVVIWLPKFGDVLKEGIRELTRRPAYTAPDFEPILSKVNQAFQAIQRIEEMLRNQRLTLAQEVRKLHSDKKLTSESFTEIVRRHFANVNHIDGTILIEIPEIQNTSFVIQPRLEGKVNVK